MNKLREVEVPKNKKQMMLSGEIDSKVTTKHVC